MNKLFLLKASFTDPNVDQTGTRYFCPYCALVNGVLCYYPELNEMLEVHYVDFERPRTKIIDLVGEENQSLPILVLDKKETYHPAKSAKGNRFIDDTDEILRYLAERYGISNAHP